MQYKRKARPRVYTARNRQSGALKVLVAFIFAVGFAILLSTFCHTLSRQTAASQILTPGLLSGEAKNYACAFEHIGI